MTEVEQRLKIVKRAMAKVEQRYEIVKRATAKVKRRHEIVKQSHAKVEQPTCPKTIMYCFLDKTHHSPKFSMPSIRFSFSVLLNTFTT